MRLDQPRRCGVYPTPSAVTGATFPPLRVLLTRPSEPMRGSTGSVAAKGARRGEVQHRSSAVTERSRNPGSIVAR